MPGYDDIPLQAFEPLPVEASAIVAQMLLDRFEAWELGVGDAKDAASRLQTSLLGQNQAWKAADIGFPIFNGGAIVLQATFVGDEARGIDQFETAARARDKVTGRTVFFGRCVGDFGRKGSGRCETIYKFVL